MSNRPLGVTASEAGETRPLPVAVNLTARQYFIKPLAVILRAQQVLPDALARRHSAQRRKATSPQAVT